MVLIQAILVMCNLMADLGLPTVWYRTPVLPLNVYSAEISTNQQRLPMRLPANQLIQFHNLMDIQVSLDA